MAIPAAGLVHHLDMSERLSFLVLSFRVLLRKQASSFLVLLWVGVVLVEHHI